MSGWRKFAEEAAGGPGDLVEQVATAALTRWAVAPAAGATKVARELACASLVGARLVDAAIEKLACDAEERAFLRALNAEAGERDLAVLTKRAFTDDPRLIGAGLGAVAGAGFGAWKHEDDRLTGAAAYAVPGAALGYIGGSLVGERGEVARAQAAHTQAAAQEHAAANAASRLELKRRIDAATLHHNTLLDAAHNVVMTHKNSSVRAQARNMIDDLTRNSQEYIAYGAANPGQIHPEFLAGYVNLPGDGLKHVLTTAKKILPSLRT